MRLDGEIAFVTGASRGLGAATAAALAAAGAAVAVTARKPEDCETVANAITATGGKAIAVSCDVTDSASVRKAVAETEGQLGPVSVLVNNAGIIEPLGSIHETAPEDWSTILEVNVVGSAATVQTVLPGMIERGSGTIVNVSSGAARAPIPGWGAYCVSKAALAMFSRLLEAEYGARGIRVFDFAPGIVDTGMQEQIRSAGVGPTASIPRENLLSPSEPARAIVFLATAPAEPFAGQEIDVRDPTFRAAAGLPNLQA